MKKLITSLIALAAPVLAHAQGCTMCYTAAAAQSKAGQHALNVGILFLLAPALTIFCGVFYVTWKNSGQNDEAEAEEGSES